jgi:3-oxoacyl-[acyl-carrier protein] reductase
LGGRSHSANLTDSISSLASRTHPFSHFSIAPEKDNADAVVAEIEALGGHAIALEADCSQPDQIKALFKAIKEKWGRCDVLVNNAGIARDSLMLRMKPEQWQQVIDINLSGVYYVSQEFFKVSTKFMSRRKNTCPL